MHSIPHRQNSTFQLRYFLAGGCKTPDGAWALMYAQKIDMEGKLRHVEAQSLRRAAKIAEAQETLDDQSSSNSQRLNAKATIIEQNADLPTWEMNLKAAGQELAAILEIMSELEPLRKYGHLDVLAATEETQREEWLLELEARAENFLFTTGSIPADQLSTMRSHPDFTLKLVPFIKDLYGKLAKSPTPMEALSLMAQPLVIS